MTSIIGQVITDVITWFFFSWVFMLVAGALASSFGLPTISLGQSLAITLLAIILGNLFNSNLVNTIRQEK